MAARRCGFCAVNYPNIPTYYICPLHATQTIFLNDEEPSADWSVQLAEGRKAQAEQAKAPSEELIPAVETKVFSRDGELYVSAFNVYRVTRERLEPGDLFSVGKQTFEVLKYLHEPRREYRVRPFSTSLSEDDLRRLADG